MLKFESYRELKKHPEAKDYRDALAKAIRIARKYNGSEVAYHELFSALETVEEGILTSPSLEEKTPANLDIEAATTFVPIHPREINDVLAFASESMQRIVRNGLERPDLSESLVINKIEGTLLPPGHGSIEPGNGGTFEKARFEPRIEEVIEILKKLDLYSDDIILTIGDVSEESMRKVSYVAIDIPRIDRMILVCNQIGQKTFVIRGRVPVETLLHTEKEDLEFAFPNRVTPIVRKGAWGERLSHALTHEMNGEQKERKAKIDVRSYDRGTLLAAILEKYPASAQWMSEYRKEKKQGKFVSVLGRGMRFIATRFGLTGDMKTIEQYIQLGQIIYGEKDPVLQQEILRFQERTPEEWRLAIVEKYPTFAKWYEAYLSGTHKEGGREIDVGGRKLGFLAQRLGIEERPYPIQPFLQLSRLIYGEKNEEIFAVEKKYEKKDPIFWQGAILKKFPTSTDFLREYRSGNGEGSEVEVEGKGLRFLGTQFGVSNDSTRRELAFRLADKVYGANDPILTQERQKIPERTPEEWKKLILLKYKTSQDWMSEYRGNGGRRQGKDIEVDGLKIIFLAKRFGIDVENSVMLKPYIELGKKIYGEKDALLLNEEKRLGGEDMNWGDAIREKYTTSAEWLKNMSGEGPSKNIGAAIDVHGRKISFLAARFGCKFPVSQEVFVRLGLRIYGDKDALLLAELKRIEPRDPEVLKMLTRKKYPTFRNWVTEFRKTKQGGGLEVDGIKLNALARQFGIVGNPSLISVFLELSRCIYGENDEELKKELERLKSR